MHGLQLMTFLTVLTRLIYDNYILLVGLIPQYALRVSCYCIHYVFYVYTQVLLRHICVYTMIEFGMTYCFAIMSYVTHGYGASKVSFSVVVSSYPLFGAGGTER